MKYRNLHLLILMVSVTAFISCNTRPSAGPAAEEGYYTEQHRPRFHFSPDSMWMNDPNGMVYYEGEYHLFYQHHPFSNVWGPMHWGHAVSPDLVHWQHLPIALYPDSLGTIFSGSAVIDWENSSGLGTGAQPPMIAIFTHHEVPATSSEFTQHQYQSIAYSLDKGRTWTKYPGNPVVKNPGINDFRDPKVIWFEAGKKWIMVLAAYDRVMFYSSPDLIHWTQESEFGEGIGAHGGVWECPDLFPLDCNGEEKWVLLVSINPGGPNGGSATQYFVGEFDGKNFINENPSAAPLWVEHGKDNYAGVTWSDIPQADGRRLFLGWMSNWQYATRVPTEKWRSAMTLPRELLLETVNGHYQLQSKPVVELQKLRVIQHELSGRIIAGPEEIPLPEDFREGLYELDLKFITGNGTETDRASAFGIMLSNSSGQQIIAGYSTSRKEVYVDRTRAGESGFSEAFAGVHTASYHPEGADQMQLHAFVDKSSIELFVDGGTRVMTEIFFPDDDFTTLSLFALEGSVTLKEGIVCSLSSIW